MPVTAPRVHFAPGAAQASRLARDDEVFVMKQFANHAGHCLLCCQPYSTFASGQKLCERGLVYAKDVSQYIYCKGGKAFSVVDRKDSDSRIQIEIPRGCDVIRDLLKAVDHGLRLPKHKPVISYEEPASSFPARYQDADLIERRPKSTSPTPASPTRRRDSVSHGGSKRDSGIFITGRGSLYRKDEADRRRRGVEDKSGHKAAGDVEPIIIRASPGVRVREYHR